LCLNEFWPRALVIHNILLLYNLASFKCKVFRGLTIQLIHWDIAAGR
jgi:hypothetical protein